MQAVPLGGTRTSSCKVRSVACSTIVELHDSRCPTPLLVLHVHKRHVRHDRALSRVAEAANLYEFHVPKPECFIAAEIFVADSS